MNQEVTTKLETFRNWLHRTRWRNRAIIALVVVPLLGHFIYTRLTVMPPGRLFQAPQASSTTSSPVNRADDFVALYKKLEPLPAVTAPKNTDKNKRWIKYDTYIKIKNDPDYVDEKPKAPSVPISIRFDPSIAYSGEWAPKIRLHQGAIVKFLETPKVKNTLDQLSALTAQSISPCPKSSIGVFVPSLMQYRSAAKLLTARARYYMAEKNNFDKALQDVQAVLQLAANLEGDYSVIALLVGRAIRTVVTVEVMHWTMEYSLTAEQLQQIIHILDRYNINRDHLWKTALRNERMYVQTIMLDSFYTKQQDGNGWNVYHNPNSNSSNRAWALFNLCSPLLDDRQTVQKKFDTIFEKLANVVSLPYSETRVQLDIIAKAHNLPTDTLHYIVEGSSYQHMFDLITKGATDYDGVRTTVALATYHRRYKRYPDQLSELVPEYMDQCPIDLFSGKPLCYRLDEQYGYVLYSVNINATDDDGLTGDGQMQQWDYKQAKDWIINRPRDMDCSGDEWILVPVEMLNRKKDKDRDSQTNGTLGY